MKAVMFLPDIRLSYELPQLVGEFKKTKRNVECNGEDSSLKSKCVFCWSSIFIFNCFPQIVIELKHLIESLVMGEIVSLIVASLLFVFLKMLPLCSAVNLGENNAVIRVIVYLLTLTQQTDVYCFRICSHILRYSSTLSSSSVLLLCCLHVSGDVNG